MARWEYQNEGGYFNRLKKSKYGDTITIRGLETIENTKLYSKAFTKIVHEDYGFKIMRIISINSVSCAANKFL